MQLTATIEVIRYEGEIKVSWLSCVMSYVSPNLGGTWLGRAWAEEGHDVKASGASHWRRLSVPPMQRSVSNLV